MRTVIIAAIAWLALIPYCRAQDCLVSAGNDFGTKMQNCGPISQIVPVKPQPGQLIIPIDGAQGTFLYQVFVKVAGPTDIRVVACGDDVIDVRGRPNYFGRVSVAALNALPETCVGKQLNQILPGTSPA